MTQPTIAQPSVMSLFLEMRFGAQPLATGTGIVVQSTRGPVLVTNRHNLTGRNPETGQPLSPTGGVPDRVLILHNKAASLGHWVQREEELYDASEKPRWVEHSKLGPKADLAALPLTQVEDVQFYSYEPAKPGPDLMVGPADVVSVVGFPFGLTGGGALAVWATGFMATEPDIDYQGLPLFLVDCRSRPGQSGSAVIAYRSGGLVAMRAGGATAFNGPVHRFLGLYSGRINAQSDLGIVWKATAISELVAPLSG